MNPIRPDDFLPAGILHPVVSAMFGDLLSAREFWTWAELKETGLSDEFIRRMSLQVSDQFPEKEFSVLFRKAGGIRPESFSDLNRGLRDLYFSHFTLSPQQLSSLITRQVQFDLLFKLVPHLAAVHLLFGDAEGIESSRFIDRLSFLPEDYQLRDILLSYTETRPQTEYDRYKIEKNCRIILRNLRSEEPAEFFADELRRIADEIGTRTLRAEAVTAYSQIIPDPFVEKRIEKYLAVTGLDELDIDQAASLLLGEIETAVKTTTLTLDFSEPEPEPETGTDDPFGELTPRMPAADDTRKPETLRPAGYPETLPLFPDPSAETAQLSDVIRELENTPDPEPVPEPEPEPEVPEFSIFDRIIQETKNELAETYPDPMPQPVEVTPGPVSLFDRIMPQDPLPPEPVQTPEFAVQDRINLDDIPDPPETDPFGLPDTVPGKSFPKLEQMMSEGQARSFIRHIFRKNEDRFYAALADLNDLPSWDESKLYIEQIYREYKTDLYSNEAIEFTDLVYSRFH